AAVKAAHGTKRPEVLTCLKKRLLANEESASVRTATLKALGASPSDDAAKALCDGIGPFLRMYVKDQIAERMSGVNIVEIQNNRDWEASYACVQKALGQGGYSCYAR